MKKPAFRWMAVGCTQQFRDPSKSRCQVAEFPGFFDVHQITVFDDNEESKPVK